MNVIILNDFGYIEGGATKVAVDSAVQLAELGQKVTYVCCVGPVGPELLNSKVNSICIDSRFINSEGSKLKNARTNIYNKFAKKKLGEILKNLDNKDTIIHIHVFCKAFSSSIFPVIEKLGFKYVVTLHDYFLICGNGAIYDFHAQRVCTKNPGSLGCLICNCDRKSYSQKLFRSYRLLVQKAHTKNIKNFISIAENNESLIKRFYPDSKYYRIYNPIEKSVEVEDFTKNDLYVFLGRVGEEKNPSLFCEAITKLSLKAVVIGDGPQLNFLKEKYSNISFTGWLTQPEILEYKKHAKCLVFTSKWYEGMPLTVGEFLLCRIPVISSDIANSTELFKTKDLIFNSDNIDSLVDVLKRFDISKDKNLFDHNFDYEDISNKFGQENHYKKLLEAYDEILSK